MISMHKKGSELSTTVDGISDWRIEYDSIDDLLKQMESVFTNHLEPRS